LDAYYERGVKPWDHAAGSLIVKEAGGQVSGLNDEQPSESLILAANKNVMPQLLKILREQNVDQGA
jgi:myo-inositol-1(or 4)-monophosphatase